MRHSICKNACTSTYTIQKRQRENLETRASNMNYSRKRQIAMSKAVRFMVKENLQFIIDIISCAIIRIIMYPHDMYTVMLIRCPFACKP